MCREDGRHIAGRDATHASAPDSATVWSAASPSAAPPGAEIPWLVKAYVILVVAGLVATPCPSLIFVVLALLLLSCPCLASMDGGAGPISELSPQAPARPPIDEVQLRGDHPEFSLAPPDVARGAVVSHVSLTVAQWTKFSVDAANPVFVILHITGVAEAAVTPKHNACRVVHIAYAETDPGASASED